MIACSLASVMRGGFNAILRIACPYATPNLQIGMVFEIDKGTRVRRSMICLVDLHFPNFFGQCLNDRTFVKRRSRLNPCCIILSISMTVYLMKSVWVSVSLSRVLGVCPSLHVFTCTTSWLRLLGEHEYATCHWGLNFRCHGGKELKLWG